MTDCLFCRIAAGEIPAEKVLETVDILAFKDIHPVAPVHVLVIPKKHIASTDGFEDEDGSLAGKMLLAARDIARDLGVAEGGYRLVTNCGKSAGQEVFHVHMHLLGGRKLGALG
ncbi:MAG: histidine triad nucleotide-binding protein [Planctomycetota bacterium]|jgi:histidine triad (HIT) family protein